MATHQKICVIAGGGAAGIFAALTVAEADPSARVVVLEKSRDPLAKVAISGGGRCNVTHACFDPDRLVSFYPRGARELRGVFHRWSPQDTIDWFQARGVPLKTEKDGRIFPVSDQSADIVNTLLHAARRAGVIVRTGQGVIGVEKNEGRGFVLRLREGEGESCELLMLATGGNHATMGYAFAESLGHSIERPVPSLFTFHVEDKRIAGLQGLSVPEARLTVDGEALIAEGPLLITHWGFSGPAVLRLSAWGARRLEERDYAFTLCVRWDGAATAESTREQWARFRREHGRKNIRTTSVGKLPQRLWSALVDAAEIPDQRMWSLLTRTEETRLSEQWLDSRFHVNGKSLFKEEFVTCGGVRLNEIDFRTMESRLRPGLFFGGELLDIDGLTGGFNLQAAWATGRAAGIGMAAKG